MRRTFSTLCVSFCLAAGCSSSAQTHPNAPAAAAADAPAHGPALHAGLNIKLVTVYVDDQEKALHFYTDVLGFTKKDDVTKGPFRWLTVTAPGDGGGMELQLALDNNPAAKAFQQAMFQQGQPAAMLFTSDVKGDYERIKARGAEFTMEPMQVTGATITMFKDTCGNLIQISQLAGG